MDFFSTTISVHKIHDRQFNLHFKRIVLFSSLTVKIITIVNLNDLSG